jgi:hypothetical protein
LARTRLEFPARNVPMLPASGTFGRSRRDPGFPMPVPGVNLAPKSRSSSGYRFIRFHRRVLPRGRLRFRFGEAEAEFGETVERAVADLEESRLEQAIEDKPIPPELNKMIERPAPDARGGEGHAGGRRYECGGVA